MNLRPGAAHFPTALARLSGLAADHWMSRLA